jgi:hypothetical protein
MLKHYTILPRMLTELGFVSFVLASIKAIEASTYLTSYNCLFLTIKPLIGVKKIPLPCFSN